MRGMTAILSREFKSYFYSPMGYIVLTFFLLFNGVVFSLLISFLNQPGAGSVTPLQLFFGGTFLFWYVLPFITAIVTMRLISEELKSGTIESLMTAPVSETTVVVGKFLAAFLYYVCLWLPTLVYVIIIARSSTVDWGPILTGYLGLLGIGSIFISVGIFSSSLTKNQIVSAIVAFVLSSLIFVTGFLEGLLTTDTWKAAVAYVNLPQHMDDFAKGVVDTRRLVFYLSTTVLFLFLTVRGLESKKWR